MLAYADEGGLGAGATEWIRPRTVRQAAREPLRRARLGPDGPTGTLSFGDGIIPW